MIGEYRVLLIRTSGLMNRLSKGNLSFSLGETTGFPWANDRLRRVKRFNDKGEHRKTSLSLFYSFLFSEMSNSLSPT